MYREWQLPHVEVRCAWSADSRDGGTWIQPATEFWGLAFGETAVGQVVELLGPAARPQSLQMQPGDRFWGVELETCVFLRGITKESLGLAQTLPSTSGRFSLGGHEHDIPLEDDLGHLVETLVATGMLAVEPSVRLALAGGPAGDSRTLRRRVRQVTALNRQQIAGMGRARDAFRLLSEGVEISEVVASAGYSDQAHLTRSLRALAGRTPGQILSGR